MCCPCGSDQDGILSGTVNDFTKDFYRLLVLSKFSINSRVTFQCRKAPSMAATNRLFKKFGVGVNLRLTASRPVCLGVRRPSGTRDQFFFLLEISFRQLRVYYFVTPYLTRGRVCNLLYNCIWALPEQSLLGRNPAELTAIFYCLI
jgi:hypothetical protein